ncbi:MAG: hypothetical protein KR126chlam4_00660 [Candidatus Anoxychlamydiales bacterium]|uniref:Uncharacterized protein n=1 Tax=marine sediment metagenome TaxID=412755 RepID=A0A0F9F4E4_9ZZZZ|nr:hypothetical protein [Candidatus Anoxychlamydiales bacterium]NGX40829.1 hypothetical protein [Candidatus Anoxychlamydiales bacterium]HEU64042.1 hypothetical protein [Chlamydiota bacterium]
MASLSSVQNRVNALRNFEHFDSAYFNELNQLRLGYGVNSTPYLMSINDEACSLHSKVEKFKNREIYYQAFKNGHVRDGYINVFAVTMNYFTALSNLNKFVRNNDIDDKPTSKLLKGYVKQYYENLRIFVEQFTALRLEYQRYLSTLPQSSG